MDLASEWIKTLFSDQLFSPFLGPPFCGEFANDTAWLDGYRFT